MARRPARRSRLRRPVAVVAALGALGAAGLAGLPPALSAPLGSDPTDCPEALPVSAAVRDLPVTGLTVAQGTTPAAFTGSVIGVLDDGIAPGLDMILVRLTSPEIDRVGGIWAGMSGSPVYVEGKLLGAVAYGLVGTSPVAGVTPAAAMGELLEPDVGPRRARARDRVEIPRRESRVILASGAATRRQVEAGMTRLPLPVAVSGVTDLDRARRMVRRLDLDSVQLYRAGAASLDVGPEAIVPGGSLGASLSYGDFSLAGVGTVTAVCGGEVIGFGHPMLWQGGTSLGLHAADTLYVQEDPAWVPFKVANVGPSVGLVDQDRLAGVKGVLGTLPETTHVSTDVTAGTRSRAGHTRVSLPDVLGEVAALALLFNQDRVFDQIGEGSALVHFVVEGTTEAGDPFRLERTNRHVSRFDISWASVFELAEHLWALDGNKFTAVDIDTVTVVEEMGEEPRLFRVAMVEQKRGGRFVEVDQGSVLRVRSGREVPLRVTMTSRRDAYGTKVVVLRVPVDARPGSRGRLVLGGGRTLAGIVERGSADSFEELIDRMERVPRNDDLVALTVLRRGGRGPGLSTTSTSVSDVVTRTREFGLVVTR